MSIEWYIGMEMSSAKGQLKVINIAEGVATLEIMEGIHKGKQTKFQVPIQRIKPLGVKPSGARIKLRSDPKMLTAMAIGFLSTHAVLIAEAPTKQWSEFVSDYGKLKGSLPTQEELANISCIKSNKWGCERRIRVCAIPMTVEQMGLVESLKMTKTQTNSIWRHFLCNNGDVWKKMVAIGFRLGKVHDIDKIRSHFEESLVEFEKGKTIGDGDAAANYVT